MKTIKRPTEPGTYAEHVTEEGFVRYYPITNEQIARRHALADALGFTMRKPCSFCTAGYPTTCQGEGAAAEGKHQHFVCYESKSLERGGYASVPLLRRSTRTRCGRFTVGGLRALRVSSDATRGRGRPAPGGCGPERRPSRRD